MPDPVDAVTGEPLGGPGETKPRELRQMNVRLPPALIEQIDKRRKMVRGGQGMTRDRWVEAALRFALAAKASERPLRSTRTVRTAPPPTRRPTR